MKLRLLLISCFLLFSAKGFSQISMLRQYYDIDVIQEELDFLNENIDMISLVSEDSLEIEISQLRDFYRQNRNEFIKVKKEEELLSFYGIAEAKREKRARFWKKISDGASALLVGTIVAAVQMGEQVAMEREEKELRKTLNQLEAKPIAKVAPIRVNQTITKSFSEFNYYNKSAAEALIRQARNTVDAAQATALMQEAANIMRTPQAIVTKTTTRVTSTTSRSY